MATSEAPYRPMVHELVPNAPLRREYLRRHQRDGLTVAELAVTLGWQRSRNDPRPDAARVMRSLGLACDVGRALPRATATYPIAVALARALDMTPYDAGV